MYEKKIPLDTSCGLRLTLDAIGGKWKSYILEELRHGPKRPSEIKRGIGCANSRVVLQQLKELMMYGMVEKKAFDENVFHSEYSVTELGRSAFPIIDTLRSWGESHKSGIEDIIRSRVDDCYR